MGKPLFLASVVVLVTACAAEMPGLGFDETESRDGGDVLVGEGGVRILSDSNAPPTSDTRGRAGASGANAGGAGGRDGALDEEDGGGAAGAHDAGGTGGASGGSARDAADADRADGTAGADGVRDAARADGARNDAATSNDARSADQTTGSPDGASDARSSKPDGLLDSAMGDVISEGPSGDGPLADATSSEEASFADGAADRHEDGRAEPDGAITCGNGVLDPNEACDDGNTDPFDGCGGCALAATHLLITEIVTRPAGAEMIEIFNPTPFAVALSDYWISDSHLYYEIATGAFPTASGSDFAAHFPDGARLEPNTYAVVALGNASGGTQSFTAAYGQMPDFELRPTANQAADDPAVPNMMPAEGGSIGASASLTDTGEPLVLFVYRGGDLAADVDYVFYGAASASNPMVDKTGIVRGASAYLADTPASAQHAAGAAGETGALHRCIYAESSEVGAQGNGVDGHDETSEDMATAFRASTAVTDRTPGAPPPLSICAARR